MGGNRAVGSTGVNEDAPENGESWGFVYCPGVNGAGAEIGNAALLMLSVRL